MTGLEALKELKHWKETNNENGVVWLPLFVVEDIEKSLKALEIIKKLFNPEKYNFLELYENPFITIGEKGEKYRIDSTDDSYIHVGIPKEEFNLLKEVLECQK